MVVASLLCPNDAFTDLPLTPSDYEFSVQTGSFNFMRSIINTSREDAQTATNVS